MSDPGTLDRLCERVADRDHVDWTTVHALAGTREEVEAVELLKVLDAVGAMHESLQTSSIDGGPPPSGSEEEAPRTWGRYRIEEAIGRGAFGTVYRAWDPDLEMPVALKILHRHVTDAALKAQLLREGRALAQVTDPNVVRVLTVEEHDGRIGLVMEFVRGDTLDAIVARQGTLNDREAGLIGEDVCRALAVVHAANLVHRDVKARNIMRERAGRIVLMDFGAGVRVAELAREGAVGTPLYMAPEILQGQQADKASDVYSVGVLLFFLVTRRHPYEGRSVDEIRRRQESGERLSLLELRPDLPLPFVRVVERALAADPRQRFGSATGLLQALRDAREVSPSWRRALTSVAVGVPALVVLLTLGGMLSCVAFDQTLGRAEFAASSVADWFVVGRRSIVLPAVITALAVGVLGLLVAAKTLLLVVAPGLRTIESRMTGVCRALAVRLQLHDTASCASWLIVLSAILFVAAVAYAMPLLQAVAADLATAPAEVFAVLSNDPAMADYHVRFRMALSLLAAANIAGWYGLVRTARARGGRPPGWLLPAEISTLVLLYGLMQLPYRHMHDGEFPAVRAGTETCLVLGQRDGRTLLFCPATMPRTRTAPANEPLVPLHRIEKLFDTF